MAVISRLVSEIRKRTGSARAFLMGFGLLVFVSAWTNAVAQDRLKTMPGYARYEKMRAESTNAVKLGSLTVVWKDDGKALEYQKDEKRYRFDIATKAITLLTNTPPKTNTPVVPRSEAQNRDQRRQARGITSEPERGRQYTSATSPDKKFTALYRDRNVWLKPAKGSNEIAITTDG